MELNKKEKAIKVGEVCCYGTAAGLLYLLSGCFFAMGICCKNITPAENALNTANNLGAEAKRNFQELRSGQRRAQGMIAPMVHSTIAAIQVQVSEDAKMEDQDEKLMIRNPRRQAWNG